MGRGDNRRTPKVLQRKSWRKLKARTRKKIEEAKGAGKKAGTTGVKKSAPKATITRHTGPEA